jgi:hypothetical protein
MTNPLLYIRNKFCFWVTGLTHCEIADLIDKVNEKPEENDYISKSDFDPDDYDFSPLSDYDFSQFVDTDFLSQEYSTTDEVDDKIGEAVDSCIESALEDHVKFGQFDRAIALLNEDIKALQKKVNKPKKAKKPKKNL